MRDFFSSVVLSTFIVVGGCAESVYDLFVGNGDGMVLMVVSIIVMTLAFLAALKFHDTYIVPKNKRRRIMNRVRWERYAG